MPKSTSLGMAAQIGLYQLLDKAKTRELMDSLRSQYDDGEQLLRELVHRGWLTQFQATKLHEGKPNQLAFGPYILLDHLAQGGMGRVYKARHRVLDRTVALKIVRREVLANSIAVARFEREAQAAAQLRHPNVVRSYDAGRAEGTYFLAMEFLEGLDVLSTVQQQGPLSVSHACDLVRQAALGLQHAHELGFIHRDIKPANLFVVCRPSGILQRPGSGLLQRASSGQLERPQGTGLLPRVNSAPAPWGVLKILDFGLVGLQSGDPGEQGALTQVGSLMGTPDFLAPEQALDSHSIDIRADLYSLGCTFYYMLAGRVPFPGGSLTEKLIRQRKEQPVAVDEARREQLRQYGHFTNLDSASEVPADVAHVLRTLTAKSPADRYQTPAELVAALDAIAKPAQKNAVVVAEPPAEPSKTVRRRRAQETVKRKQASSCQTAETVVLASSPLRQQCSHRPARLRRALVAVGFLLCCALCTRPWPNQMVYPEPLRSSVPALSPASGTAVAQPAPQVRQTTPTKS